MQRQEAVHFRFKFSSVCKVQNAILLHLVLAQGHSHHPVAYKTKKTQVIIHLTAAQPIDRIQADT